MRGADRETAAMFSYVSPEALVPADFPLRAIRPLVNAALDRLSGDFDVIYSPSTGIRSRRRSCCWPTRRCSHCCRTSISRSTAR